MNLKQIIEKTNSRQISFDVNKIMPLLRNANDGAIRDVIGTHALYYKFLPNLIDEIKPKQITELGGAMGVACLCMLSAKYQDFDLWSISLQEHGLEFDYIVDDFKNLHMTIGDDLDLGNWARKLDLANTDLWFFDSLHTVNQLTAELDLYEQFFKKDAIILFDDIHSFGLDPVWNLVTNGQWGEMETEDASYLHETGFGICKVK